MVKKAILQKQNEKMKRQLFIWENIGIGVNSSLKEKELAAKTFLDSHKNYNLYEVAETIKINRGTLYHHLYTKVEKPWFVKRKEMLTKEVIKIFNESKQIYGAGKIQLVLQRKNIKADKKTILKIMSENNLIKKVIIKKKKPLVNKERRSYYRNLLKRQFNQDEPNNVWNSDFLEINVNGVRFYLCVILDLFARKVIAWRLSHNLNDNLIINTFKDAFETRNEPIDLLFHSDQGPQFKSYRFMEMLRMLGVKQSFSYPGSPNDNACMEGFYSKLRSEEINANIEYYENSKVIKEYLSSYFELYNNVRIHTANGGLTPNEKEEIWFKQQKESVQ